jgi:hypothetical protein
VALASFATALNRPEASAAAARTPEALYAAEHELLTESRFVPIVALGEAFAVAPRLRNWRLRRDGVWGLADVWVQEAP